MADYIYTLETRLTPEQMRGVTLVQDIARSAELNIYLTGGAVRDILTGFPIRDLDFTVQGNPLKLQKDLERAGAVIHGVDEHTHTLYLNLPGNVRAEISMARTEVHEKTGKRKPSVPFAGSIRHVRDFFTISQNRVNGWRSIGRCPFHFQSGKLARLRAGPKQTGGHQLLVRIGGNRHNPRYFPIVFGNRDRTTRSFDRGHNFRGTVFQFLDSHGHAVKPLLIATHSHII